MTHLSFEQLEDRLASFSYKPGWTMELHESESYAGSFLMISFEAEDAYRPGRRTIIGIRSALPPIEFFRCHEMLDQWLLSRVIQAENHEAKEWLKCDGVMIFDPHKGS